MSLFDQASGEKKVRAQRLLIDRLLMMRQLNSAEVAKKVSATNVSDGSYGQRSADRADRCRCELKAR